MPKDYRQYTTVVEKAVGNKPSQSTMTVDIYALRQNPGVVNKYKGQMVNTAAKGSRLPMKDEGRR